MSFSTDAGTWWKKIWMPFSRTVLTPMTLVETCIFAIVSASRAESAWVPTPPTTTTPSRDSFWQVPREKQNYDMHGDDDDETIRAHAMRSSVVLKVRSVLPRRSSPDWLRYSESNWSESKFTVYPFTWQQWFWRSAWSDEVDGQLRIPKPLGRCQWVDLQAEHPHTTWAPKLCCGIQVTDDPRIRYRYVK